MDKCYFLTFWWQTGCNQPVLHVVCTLVLGCCLVHCGLLCRWPSAFELTLEDPHYTTNEMQENSFPPHQNGGSAKNSLTWQIYLATQAFTTKSKEIREVKTFSTKTSSDVGMVPCVSEVHVCLHGKVNWQKTFRNKEGYLSMLSNPGQHSAVSYFLFPDSYFLNSDWSLPHSGFSLCTKHASLYCLGACHHNASQIR